MKKNNYEQFRVFRSFKTNTYKALKTGIRCLNLSRTEKNMFANPMFAIRDKCMECCKQNKDALAKCSCYSCPLWCYRFGGNPFRSGKGEQNGTDKQN